MMNALLKRGGGIRFRIILLIKFTFEYYPEDYASASSRTNYADANTKDENHTNDVTIKSMSEECHTNIFAQNRG